MINVGKISGVAPSAATRVAVREAGITGRVMSKFTEESGPPLSNFVAPK